MLMVLSKAVGPEKTRTAFQRTRTGFIYTRTAFRKYAYRSQLISKHNLQ